MSKKQQEFINKLLNEKAIAYFQIQAEYHYKTGGRSHLPNVDELNSFQARFAIEKLLASPNKKNETQIAHFKQACNKYDLLVSWAKKNGVKVKSKMKKQTILNMIREAGLEVPAELI